MKKDKSALDPNEILIAEFNYAAQTAQQANEDREKVTSFYFISFGTLIAAAIGSQFISESNSFFYWFFSGLFIFLGITGLLTNLQIIRLRKAWIESAQAMNKIKQLYMNKITEEGFIDAFIWKTNSIPKKNKTNSVSFIMVVEVSFLGSIAFGLGIFLFAVTGGHTGGIAALVAGSFFFVFQILLFRML